MADLGQIIREIQRAAAALPTDELRTEIEIELKVQDAAIGQFYAVTRPGAGNADDLIAATGTVMISVLTTALYVRELASRPVDRFTVGISPN
jgi:hypothetical protein